MRLLDIAYSHDIIAGPPVNGVESTSVGRHHVTIKYATDDGIVRTIFANDPVCGVITEPQPKG